MEVDSLKTPKLLSFKCIYVSYPVVFSRRGFYVNLVFFFLFSYFIIVPLIITRLMDKQDSFPENVIQMF